MESARRFSRTYRVHSMQRAWDELLLRAMVAGKAVQRPRVEEHASDVLSAARYTRNVRISKGGIQPGRAISPDLARSFVCWRGRKSWTESLSRIQSFADLWLLGVLNHGSASGQGSRLTRPVAIVGWFEILPSSSAPMDCWLRPCGEGGALEHRAVEILLRSPR